MFCILQLSSLSPWPVASFVLYMKKIPLVTGAAGILLAAVLLAGQPASVAPPLSNTELPEDLDEYLQESEAHFSDITPGTNKTIIWADSSRKQTPRSLVYLHGFSATRQETAPVSDSLAQRWGGNLFYTRLTGHGRTTEAMGEATADDWLQDATEALDVGKRLGERVVLIGTSTGGTLAAWLAAQPEASEVLDAVILISPNFWPRAEGVGLLLWPYGRLLGKAVQGDYVEWEPANEAQAMYWTHRYPIGAAVEMMRLVKYVNDLDFAAVNVPVLILYSPEDQVVDPAYIRSVFDKIGSQTKEIIALENVEAHNNHVLAGAIISPGDTQRVIDYIDQFVRGLPE